MKQLLFVAFLLYAFYGYTQSYEDSIKQRNANWRSDLEFLQQKIKDEHYLYTHTISAEEFDAMVRSINSQIPQMTDLDVIGALFKLTAAIGDGHTQLNPPFQGPLAFKLLPLEFYFFEKELYVRAASPEYANLVGSRVIRVGNKPIKEILNDCAPLIGRDNDQQLQWILPIALIFSDTYQLIGAIPNRDVVAFTFLDPEGKEFKSKVTAGPLDRDPMARFAPSHWAAMKNAETNMWTRDPENFYWYEHLEDKKTVYFQFNQVRNKEEQSLADFCKEMFEFIDQNDVKNLIIDIRLNNGGNNFLNRDLIHEIIKCEKINREGNLFTIIGRRTFSAAMNLTSDLENQTTTLFVGEPTSSRPNFYGEDNPFELPFSKLTGSISSRYWQGGKTSDDNRPWIVPDISVDLSAEDYMNSVDPAINAIWTFMQDQSE